ncbi:phosphonate metabolism protein/1,5-bisphosphokinase (PRPP-forming) PhnN [Roseococcus sp. SYP-B2431]|uniref:phosphonate metabolism protein/1,5-bisphosphokinase (PRPP-forming) PhnN n=1 Tax=Roseococcus sp. SYP-B2431 TaxID=2496640 RepID=UPI00103AAE08|nr:phosphonate metabolism protein/1,5-bisphosphokinase (PRPP-forming) PhnN [Roseococcus sp. SYP-B2431]TCH97666.1 phosphonate metabolism protein/1,5-bisphosphokinase (PRPP-forming) PhnN [Roseococcus sp. SYP-B2431]
MIWVALAGPSGAGKDSLLDRARDALAGDGRFHFARRTITRPAEAGGEAHDAVSSEEFQALAEADAFVLTWQAHGLRYGIRRSEAPADKLVVLSVSRTVLHEAARLRPLRVIEVTAPRELLAERLARRGRETAEQIAARLDREMGLPEGLDLRRIRNDSTIEEGAARLRHVLEAAASSCAAGAFRP